MVLDEGLRVQTCRVLAGFEVGVQSLGAWGVGMAMVSSPEG